MQLHWLSKNFREAKMHFQATSALLVFKNVFQDNLFHNLPHRSQYCWPASSSSCCIFRPFLKTSTALAFSYSLGTRSSLLSFKNDRAHLQAHLVAIEFARLQGDEWLHLWQTPLEKLLCTQPYALATSPYAVFQLIIFLNKKFLHHANTSTPRAAFPIFNSYTSRIWNLNT